MLRLKIVCGICDGDMMVQSVRSSSEGKFPEDGSVRIVPCPKCVETEAKKLISEMATEYQKESE